ncbi:YolD-like family protein [Saccharibacillus sp. CPCC 101409]|uniref:YolD-like family protein n=1 Tax=Saccharibacillus sp. CPCC 101409 TaxID=3058041 RepID=UPI002673FDD6|nr:YolD-like family protein [Saccharibacillus sp. CPCC 101409]MDO3411890.1 YolD-like family protein [Saccharibacillus sp. CPCC 101409]
MTKKLEGNGLWESSRMLLPEYRARIERQSRESIRAPRPELHQDALEDIAEALKHSLAAGRAVRLKLHGEYGGEFAEGVVIDASPMSGVLKLRSAQGVRRIAYSDIIGAEPAER